MPLGHLVADSPAGAGAQSPQQRGSHATELTELLGVLGEQPPLMMTPSEALPPNNLGAPGEGLLRLGELDNATGAAGADADDDDDDADYGGLPSADSSLFNLNLNSSEQRAQAQQEKGLVAPASSTVSTLRDRQRVVSSQSNTDSDGNASGPVPVVATQHTAFVPARPTELMEAEAEMSEDGNGARNGGSVSSGGSASPAMPASSSPSPSPSQSRPGIGDTGKVPTVRSLRLGTGSWMANDEDEDGDGDGDGEAQDDYGALPPPMSKGPSDANLLLDSAANNTPPNKPEKPAWAPPGQPARNSQRTRRESLRIGRERARMDENGTNGDPVQSQVAELQGQIEDLDNQKKAASAMEGKKERNPRPRKHTFWWHSI
jgi:hypothetical protein